VNNFGTVALLLFAAFCFGLVIMTVWRDL